MKNRSSVCFTPVRSRAAFGLVFGYGVLVLAPIGAGIAWGRWPEGWPGLATGLGIAGLAMLLVQFLLSGRFRFIGACVGIDRVMWFHNWAARWLTLFLVLHPFLYFGNMLWTDPSKAFGQFIDMAASPLFASGVIAWGLLLVIMAGALWRRRIGLDYEWWRLSHGIGAVLIILAGLHHMWTMGGIGAGYPVILVWIILALVAAIAALHIWLLRPLSLTHHPYMVRTVEEVGAARWILRIAPEKGGALPFRAGQFAWLTVGETPFSIGEHPFSISSAPNNGDVVEFLIREAGDFTSHIGDIKPGARAWLDGPHGAFTLPDADQHRDGRVVMIAGGVGLAPILSILRDQAGKGDRRKFHLIFGNRTEAQIVMAEELQSLGRTLDLKVDMVLSEPKPGWSGATGQLSGETLDGLLSDEVTDASTLFMLCGPPMMVDVATDYLSDHGVAGKQIIVEHFDFV